MLRFNKSIIGELYDEKWVRYGHSNNSAVIMTAPLTTGKLERDKTRASYSEYVKFLVCLMRSNVHPCFSLPFKRMIAFTTELLSNVSKLNICQRIHCNDN